MLYAAYGSNLHPRRLRERIADATLVGTSYLREYSLRFHKRGQDRSAKCGISKCGQGMHVAVYDVDEAGRQMLDAIEGVGKGYHVGELNVPGFGSCFSYFVARTHVDEDLQPFDWYREMVLLGCLTHAFPEAYCERVAALPVTIDPDPGRHRANWRIVDVLRDK